MKGEGFDNVPDILLLPQPDKQSRLLPQRIAPGVVPDNVVSPFHFFFQRHLRLHHFFGDSFIEWRAELLRRQVRARGSSPLHGPSFPQPAPLDVGRAGHDHNPIAQSLSARFIKKWDISKEEIGRITVGLRFSAPLAANARMENFFERVLFRRALENYRSKSSPIQVARRRINVGPEFTRNFPSYVRVQIDQLARGLVGIKKCRGGNDFTQAVAKRRFAGGDPTGDTNGRHVIVRKLRYLRFLLFDSRPVISCGRCRS
jgi:hypothetical protein